MKDNTTLLGYENLNDFIQTNFGIHSAKQNIILTIFGGLSSFISNYIYNDVNAVYFLLLLLLLDFVSGVWRAIVLKKFTSARMPRIVATAIIYCGLLSVSWHIAKFAPVYSFLPGAIYAVFAGTLFKSLIENIKDLKLLSKDNYKSILKVFDKSKD